MIHFSGPGFGQDHYKHNTMQKTLAHRTNWIFVLITLAAWFLLTRIPLQKPLETIFDENNAKQFRYLVISLLVIITCTIGAARLNILKEGGFRGHQTRNYWMYLLPLLVPGLYLLRNLQSCSDQLWSSAWLSLALVTMIRAIMEEVLCRGFIQGYLEKYNPKPSRMKLILFSSIVFALLHFLGLKEYHFLSVLVQVIYAFFVGMLFGALLLRTRNVWLLGIIHGLLNIFSKSCNASADNETVGSMGEYLASLGGIVLMFSPMLFFAWLLVKTYKPPVGKES